MKDQLDVTCCFISLLMRSTCFGQYIHHQELAIVLMNYHIGRLVLSSLCVGAFGAAGFRWCPCCRLQPENKTTDVVIHQHNRKLLMMDILKSETC